MKKKMHADLFTDSLRDASNHVSQVVHDLKELKGEMEVLGRAATELARRRSEYAPPVSHGVRTVDPSVDPRDPGEHLAILQGGLRRIAQNLKLAFELLEQRNEELAALLLQE